MSKLLREYLTEVFSNKQFINHLRNGLNYAGGAENAEAMQIAADWLEEAEVCRGILLPMGQVTQIERFVIQQWPTILEQFRGNRTQALRVMTNLLDSSFNELR